MTVDPVLDYYFDRIRAGLERSEQHKPPHERYLSYQSANRASGAANNSETSNNGRPNMLLGSKLRNSLLNSTHVPPKPKQKPPTPFLPHAPIFTFFDSTASSSRSDTPTHQCAPQDDINKSASDVGVASRSDRKKLTLSDGCASDASSSCTGSRRVSLAEKAEDCSVYRFGSSLQQGTSCGGSIFVLDQQAKPELVGTANKHLKRNSDEADSEYSTSGKKKQHHATTLEDIQDNGIIRCATNHPSSKKRHSEGEDEGYGSEDSTTSSKNDSYHGDSSHLFNERDTKEVDDLASFGGRNLIPSVKR